MTPTEVIITKNQEDLHVAIMILQRIRAEAPEDLITFQEKDFILGYLSTIEDRMLAKMEEYYDSEEK